MDGGFQRGFQGWLQRGQQELHHPGGAWRAHLLLQPWATSLPLSWLQPHWPPSWSSSVPGLCSPRAFAPAVSAGCSACRRSGSGCSSTFRSQPPCPQGGQPEAEGPSHAPGILHLPVPPGVSVIHHQPAYFPASASQISWKHHAGRGWAMVPSLFTRHLARSLIHGGRSFYKATSVNFKPVNGAPGALAINRSV